MIVSVSVDLDGLGCYAAIHGLGPETLDEAALRAVPVVALGRLCEVFASLGVKATLFAIGQELALPGAAASLRGAAEAGHEVASHSFAHDYALSRRAQADIEADLVRAEEAISACVGAPPRGFRAPGYTLSPALLAAVRARGYAYDASLLPSPPYYAAKAAVMGLHALRGRRSHSILGAPGQLFARRGPHVRAGVRELPVATLPGLRVPVIGTSVLGVSETLGRRLVRGACVGVPHVDLELHGIDALDASDVPAAIAAAQPGLKTAATLRLQRLRAVLAELLSRGRNVTLLGASSELFGAC